MNAMTPPAVDRAPPVLNPLDPAFIADPYPLYHRLRDTAPVHKTPLGFWVLSRYEDVALSLKDRRFGKDFAGSIRRRYGADFDWTGAGGYPDSSPPTDNARQLCVMLSGVFDAIASSINLPSLRR